MKKRRLTALFLCAALLGPALVRADFNNAVFLYARGDYPEAFLQMQALAETANHELAMYYLGIMYLKGQGVERDYETAARWFLKAATQAIPQAQFQLGNLYSEGKGVPRDYERAYAWYQASIALDHAPSQSALARTEEKLSAEELAQAKILAREYTAKYGQREERSQQN